MFKVKLTVCLFVLGLVSQNVSADDTQNSALLKTKKLP